jgi:hypothetical protein
LPSLGVYTANWAYDSGGNETDSGYTPNDAGTAENNINGSDSLPADGPGFATPGLGYVWDYFSVSTPDGTFQRSSGAQVMIVPSGQEQAGTTNVYLVLASAMAFSDPIQDFGEGSGDLPVAPETMAVNGQALINTGITNVDGSVFGGTKISAKSGVPAPLTTTAPVVGFTFANRIFQLISQCVATTPSNRARTNIGVGEQVNLYFNPALPTTNITWSVPAGSLSVTNNSSTNLFTAPDNATNVTVTATIGSMPVNFYFQVFAPTGVVFVKLGEKHTQGSLDAGFHAQCILSPTNVSFYNIEISEMNATYTGSGCFAFINGQIHKTWTQQGAGWLTPGQNNYLNPEVDYTYVSSVPATGPGPGTDSCPIPWNYRTHGATNDGYNFATLTSSAIATANTCTKSKNGMNSTTFNISDPTVNW